ncbi:NTP transferase domain-containing protein [Antrihabitans cavernicola]|uniref:Molybdopterin molybdenumtransferase n=1 Tax=Antrihabitans cavernicola TaxID=2495913 RepID=A0A5A7SCZ8_9NOCA|nr:NTP transferase domain-containing protein [Spelaeibacter cavernicola]KAA0024030.1 molybdenum cofactor biosynthesis protein [Spelaeibacter cavernicola]
MLVDAIILAGGRASRMGGVDKPAIAIGGRTMLDAAVAAVSGCDRIVVVGPQRPELPTSIVQTQERPPGAGPVAAIGAALDALPNPAPSVVVLAADMPFLSAAAVTKLAALSNDSGADAVFAIDDDGRPQHLLGVWRTAALVERVAALGSLDNQAMKALVPNDITSLHLDGIGDCDTVDDVHRAVDLALSARTLTLDDARELLRTTITRLPYRTLPLHAALGAALADPIRAAQPLPRFDVSAMDGYAVAGDGPWQLRNDVGYAGGDRPSRLDHGEAVRIATGAHVPDGSTSVVRDEFAALHDGVLTRIPDAPIRNDIRRSGEDWPAGRMLAESGTHVTPALLSAARSGDVFDARVRGPVRAHVVVTGDEIRRDGPLRDGQTRDSLGPVLPNLLAWCGIRTAGEAHLRDTANGFDEMLAAATDADLIVIVGATGGGAADQLRTALDRCGANLLVHRVSCRPGGSQVVAELADHRIVLGLPGNPYAATATLLVTAPAIVDGLTGRIPRPRQLGVLVNAGAVAANTTRIVPARVDRTGEWIAETDTRTAHLARLIDCHAVAIVQPDTRDGDTVELVELPN